MADEVKNAKNGEKSTFSRVYEDTTFFVDSIVEEYSVFPAILQMMRDGNATIELKKRYLLRAIDEAWVNIIEDTLPALDTIIRNPSRYIEEREEVLPIELSRNISSRSMKHLSQHTDLIASIEGDRIIPSKILNVFHDETMQTYENKFINTLINRLFAFVSRRYEIAKKAGQDEKTTSLEFTDSFDHDNVKVNMNIRLEIAESSDEEDTVERNYSKTTDLWRRVEKLNSIITTYANSEFVANMGKSYIRPPVMRTNAIMKNKNLHQCLMLWQFIETYESAGYSMIVQESLENVDESYIKELYSTLALQYLIFRYNIHNEFDTEHTLDSEISDKVISPKFVDRLSGPSDDEFDIVDERVPESPSAQRYRTLTPDDQLMLTALNIALQAQEIISASGQQDEFEHPFVPEPEPAPVAPEPEPEPEPEPKPEPEEPAEAAKPAEPSAVPIKVTPRRIAAPARRRIRVTVKKGGDTP